MKLLYYSTAYYAHHGGSIQSIEFFKNLEDFREIEEVKVFPVKEAHTVSDSKNDIKQKFRSFLRKVPLLQILFFYRRNRMYLTGVIEILEKYKPDAIIIQIDSNILQIEKLKSRFPEIIISTQVNGSPFDEPFKNIAFKKYFLEKQKNMYAQADLNFFISDFLRKRIMGKSLLVDRDKVVHNGTDIDKFKPLKLKDKKSFRKAYNYPENKFILGYIGTLDYHKKVNLLINSLNRLSDKFKDVTLVIIGDGPGMMEIKKQVNELSLGDRVILKGWVDHDIINNHLNCFDIAIHHHANDYMSPLKIFEYLASGLPVIAPNIPAVREIFIEDKELVFTNPTEEDITKNIYSLIMDEKKRSYLAGIGPKIIKERLTWQSYTKNIVEDLVNFGNK